MKRKAAMKRKGRVKLSDVVIEIEVPTEIDSFTKFEILDEYGRTYKSWIQQCYLHRMREILTNPTEFGILGYLRHILRQTNGEPS